MSLNINYSTDLEVKSERTTIDRAFFNRRLLALYNQLVALDVRMQAYDALEATLIQTELERLNSVLTPLYTVLQEAGELGFLVCRSDGTAISLVEGEAEGFWVTDGAELFTPTPFLLVQDADDFTNWGIVSLDEGGWHKETGDLATHCVYANKTQSSTHWVISANSAVLPVMRDLLTDTVAAKDLAVAANDSIAGYMQTISDALEAIAEGPVASVNGYTGVIDLAVADITGLTDALAAKVSTAALAAKQDANSKLTALVVSAWAANKISLQTGASTISNISFTALAQSLVAGVTPSDMQSTLGVDPFVKSLLAIADASAFRTAIGVEATPDVPVKAPIEDVVAGVDDTKFLTPATAATVYSKKLLEQVVASANFTLDNSYNGRTVAWTKATAGTITLANNAPVNTECLILQEGAGQITFAAQAGGTVHSRGERLRSTAQYAFISVFVYSNTGGSNAAWRLSGDLMI